MKYPLNFKLVNLANRELLDQAMPDANVCNSMSSNICPVHCAEGVTCGLPFMPLNNHRKWVLLFPHFTDGETESQRGHDFAQGSHRLPVVSSGDLH